jgi:hypothetical protein
MSIVMERPGGRVLPILPELPLKLCSVPFVGDLIQKAEAEQQVKAAREEKARQDQERRLREQSRREVRTGD